MDTRSLQVYLALADTLSFSRVAQQQHMSLSAVSRMLARIEGEVGQRLFERDRRSVRLTRAGQRFRHYAQESLGDWQRLLGDLNPDQDNLRGEINIYGSVTASYSVLSPVLERTRMEFPGIEIMLHTGDYADALDLVLAGEEDIAVAARPDELSSRLDFLALQGSPLQFIAPSFACAVADQVATLDPLSEDFSWGDVPFIVTERGLSRERVDAWFRRRGQRPRIYAQVTGHEAIAAMVGLGLGVGVIPQLVLENSTFKTQLSCIPVQAPLQEFVIGLCALRQRLDNPLVAAFWNVAADSYGVAI